MGPSIRSFCFGGLAGGFFVSLLFILTLDRSREQFPRSAIATGQKEGQIGVDIPASSISREKDHHPDAPRNGENGEDSGVPGKNNNDKDVFGNAFRWTSSDAAGESSSTVEGRGNESTNSRDSSKVQLLYRAGIEIRTGLTVGRGRDNSNHSNWYPSMDDLRKAMPATVVCPKNPGEYGPVAKDGMECRKRLPNIIGIGVEKCGTAAISFFLQSHPFLVHAHPMEVFFWNRHLGKGLDWYRDRMPVSSKYQVTMEKTPSYFWDRAVAGNISELMREDTKFIVVVRDPVVRAVSHWIHLGAKIDTFKKGTFSDRPLLSGQPSLCYLNTTFEKSVLRPDGNLMENNCIIRHCRYVDYLQFWMDLFAKNRFLVLDGDDFIANPLPALRILEDFIGLPRYFDETRVEFNQEKGFYCLAGLKLKAACMSSGKGRPHPDVDENVVKKLRKHFHPYNKKLEEMTGQKFSWS